MSEMNVSMKLTLSDLASGPLRQFVGQLDVLSSKITALNAKFTSFSNTSRAFNASNQASASSITGLNARVDALIAGLSTMTAKLTSSVAAMESLAPASNAAAVGLQNTTRSLDGVAGSASRAKDSIRGLVEAYGALKIAKGLDKSARSEYDLQMQEARLKEAGISPQAARYARDQSLKMSQSIGIVSQNDVFDARRKLIAAIGQNKEKQVDSALPDLIRNAYVVKALYQPRSSIGDIVGSFAGGAELLGRTHSAKGLTSASDILLKAQGGSQGRMTQGDMESVLRQNKYNPLLNDKSFLWLMSFAEQLKNLGGGGGGGRGVTMAGTGFSMLSKTIMNPKMSKQTAAMYARLGMFGGDAANLATSTTGTVSGNMLLGASNAIHDMPGWIERVLAPHMLAYIKKHPEQYGLSKVPTAEEINGALTKASIELYGSTGGVNVASMVIAASSPEKMSMLRSHQQMMENTKTGQDAVNQIPSITTSWSKITTSLTNLANMIGENINPKIKELLDWVAKVTQGFVQFAAATPGVAAAISDIAVAFGALLAIRASAWLLRIIGLIGSLGAASTTAAATVATSSAAMMAVWRARLLAMGVMALRFVSIIGIAFLLKDAADNIKVGGITISNHIAALIFGLFSQFNRFFAWLNGKFATMWDKATNFANSVTGKTGFLANAGRALGINNYTTPDGKGVSNDAVNPFRKYQSGFKSAQRNWDNAGVDALTQRGNGKYHPKDGADALASFEHAMNERVNQVVLGPNTPIGAMNKSGSGSSVSANARQQNQAMQRALDFLRNMQATNDPIQQIKNKFQPNIMALSSGGRVDLAAQAESLMNQQIADETKKLQQKKLELLKKELSDLQAELSAKQAQNAALVTAGVLTPDQAQARTIADQKAAAPELLKAAEAVRAYEKAMGESTTKIDTTIARLNALGNELTQLQQKISNAVQGAFQTFFDQLMGGKTSWKDMGRKFVQNLMRGINSAVSQNLSKALVDGIFGTGTSAGKGLRSINGSDGFMKTIGSWLGNGFGTAGGSTPKAPSTTSSAPSGWMSALGSVMSAFISSFAVGADNIPNDMVAQIHKGEMIIPAAGAEAIRSGKLGGGAAPNVNFTINAMDSQSVLGAMGPIQRELAMMLAGANANLNLGG